ncbi:GD13275 [Drosophila simulans]|uniref:GD13275 n=1 Tax=Drosophila simulans TaxID=7240 RepID=B4QQI3_DROSI|nr:GD13275 [Drosophila simulans]
MQIVDTAAIDAEPPTGGSRSAIAIVIVIAITMYICNSSYTYIHRTLVIDCLTGKQMELIPVEPN